jgi:hypothetical protein
MGMLSLLEFKTGNFMNPDVEGMDKELCAETSSPTSCDETLKPKTS